MPASTQHAARILGPLLLVAAGVFLLQSERLLDALNAFVADELFAFFAGFITLLFGLVLLAFHWKWSGLTQSLVSLLGMIALLRGGLLLFLPDVARAMALSLAATPAAFPIAGAVVAPIGAWLSFVGWFGKAV